MIYDILTYLIIAIATLALGWKFLHFFNFVGKKATGSNCSGCNGSCETSHIKFPKKEALKSYDRYRIRL